MSEAGKQSQIEGERVRRVAPLVGMAGRTAGEAVAASLRKRRHREFAARALRDLASYVQNVGRKIRGGSDYTFIARLESGTISVLGGLRSTGPWRAIRDEYYSGAAPATAYGELDAAHRRAQQ
jgi:hypothetical protein